MIEFDDERHDPECATRTKKRDWRCDCSREALKARVKELESALRLVLDSPHDDGRVGARHARIGEVMSFADRLQNRPPMPIAAVKPTKSMPVSLCLPQVVTVEGHVVGLVNMVNAPMLVAGVESTRILTALEETLSGDCSADELREAAQHIRQHLDSLDAAEVQAHAEHDATHDHERDSN